MKHKEAILAALFLALGTVLPLFTAQIKEIGDTLLPMHLPVLLCGLLCGPRYGLLVGLVLPFFRGVVFGMPPVYPNSVWMAVELTTYGGVIGFLYEKTIRKSILSLYACLVSAMFAGRITWGIAKAILLGMADKPFGWEAFFAGGVLDALPGIVLQLVLIPSIMMLLQRRNRHAEKTSGQDV